MPLERHQPLVARCASTGTSEAHRPRSRGSRWSRRAGVVATVWGVSAVLAGCADAGSGGEGDDGGAGETGETITVVTSIDVYADLVGEIAGETAEVQPMVDSTAVDPHSYEATPQDRLAVDSADVIVANGGGYDAFLTQLAGSAGKQDQVYQLIEGENEHSHGDDGGYENEHIWYDLDQMQDFVAEFSDYLAEEVPDNSDLYQENAEALEEELAELKDEVEAVSADGLSFLATESVSGFLLEDAGFEDLTDEQFLAAVEHGDDVSPRLYQQALDIATGDDIGLLAYNPQTETSQSEQIRSAAEDADVEVMEFSETLPDGVDSYVEWMHAQIEELDDTVSRIDG